MKTTKTFLCALLLILCSGCVQKSYKKTVVFTVDVSGVKNIKTVGIRGNDKPLTWDYNLPLTAMIKDSLYSVVVSSVTGYKFTEVKFVVNDDFEFPDKGNRRIYYDENNDTTFYKASFNKR